jgi:transposase
MAKQLVSDELWNTIKPLLPPERPKPKGGRPRVPARATLTGILFVLLSGIPWEMLPQEMGCGAGMTCWRRLREWQQAGVWEDLRLALLDRLAEAGQIDWSRVSVDAASVAAPLASPDKGSTSPDKGSTSPDKGSTAPGTAEAPSTGEAPPTGEVASPGGPPPSGEAVSTADPPPKKRKRGLSKLKPLDRTRRIAANRARSATLRSTAMARP